MRKQDIKLSAKDLTLNIAVNLERVSRWAMEGKEARINQFLIDTEHYVNQLNDAPKNEKFINTFTSFQKKFQELKTENLRDENWAEDALTWANILTHRAKLA